MSAKITESERLGEMSMWKTINIYEILKFTNVRITYFFR